MHRLGKPRSDKPRPIRIVGFDGSGKIEILKKSRSLKDDRSHSGIYVNADLTPRQQKEAKDLRDELKRRRAAGEQDIVIYRSKIVQKSQIQNFH